MGLIRKASWLTSGGIVRPTTKKEKHHAELLAAIQGERREDGTSCRWTIRRIERIAGDS